MTEPGVSLREHLECRIEALDRRQTELAIERNRAVEAALVARKEEAVHHNGLIDAMKDQQSMFVTRGQLTATLVAALGGIGTLVGILAYVVK